jgi:hypothetical protein
LRYLAISNGNETDFIYDAYTTLSYSHNAFQKADVEFNNSFNDYGLDTDGDGRYNSLNINVGASVLVNGNYTLVGHLYDKNDEEILMADTSVYLSSGSNTIHLSYDGITLYLHGVTGPYTLKYLSLHDDSGSVVDIKSNAFNTYGYNFTDFQKPPVPLIVLSGTYSDHGTDTDGDGAYDYLSINAEVSLSGSGYVFIRARLMDSKGSEIIWAENITHLNAGVQTIQLNFDGDTIYNHGVDGPYYLKDVYIYHTGDPSQPDYVSDAYTTAAYHYIDFGMGVTSLSLSAGWNLVSVSRPQSNDSAEVVFPGKYGSMFGYDQVLGDYAEALTMEVGLGYWVFYTGATTITINGPIADAIKIDCKAGWNLIGSREKDVQVADLQLSVGSIYGSAFYYDTSLGDYAETMVISSGQGIWIYVTEDCELTIP